MTYTTGMRSAACIAALFAGGAAQADVTAAQVWENWKSQIALYGNDSLSIGSEETSGGTLTVRDIMFAMNDDVTNVTADLGDVTFAERGDGTVSVTMAESYPITIKGEDGVVVTIVVSQTGMELIASGDADVMQYEVSAESYGIALDDIVDGDITFNGDISAVANNLSGSYTTRSDAMRNISYGIDVVSLDLNVDVQVPGDDGGYVTASGKINGISAQSEMSLPVDVDLSDPAYMANSDVVMRGGYTIDSATYVFDIDAEGDRVVGMASTGAARLDGFLDSGSLSYKGQTNDLAVNMTVPDLPFPIEFSMAQYGLGLEMPLAKSEEPSDFGLSVDLIDLTFSDMIWDLFDAGNVLPRDPATIQVDVTGTATLGFDLMDPAQAMAMETSDMPVALNSVALNNLRLALAGALVTGTGDFTFDNSDMQTFDGMPRPEGDAVIEIKGLNGLMDNLVAMGLVPEDQIMGGRMMLGMFARTTGDDQLETKLEINGQGHLIVNGQRLR